MENPTQDVKVDSSATTETAFLEPEQLTSEQRNDWLLKGEIPKAEQPGKPATPETSSEPPSGEQPAEGEKPAPVSETGNPPETKPAKGNRGAEARIRELVAENKRLMEQLQPRTTQQPQQTQQTQQTQQPKPLQRPVRPKLTDFEDFTKYEEATDKYHEDLADFKAAEKVREFQASQAQAAQQSRIQEANRQIAETWTQQVTKAREVHEDFDTVVGDGKQIGLTPVMHSFILSSPLAAEMTYRLASDLPEAHRIAQLNPADCVRALVKLELAIEPPKETTPSPKKVTQAPPPARDIRARNTAPVDEVEKAVADDDFRKFYELENSKARR